MTVRAESLPLPLVINIEGGQGSLALENLPLSGLGRIDQLTMKVPELRFPFDLSGGAARFRNRRCVLTGVTLSFGAGDIVSLLQSAPLSAHGILRPIMEMGPDGFTLQARVEMAGHAAELCAAGYVRVAPPRSLRLACYDLRLHGFVPVAAPLVVTALLRAVTGASASMAASQAPVRPAPHARGPAEITFDPLEMALYDVFASRGWRLPARRDLSLMPVGHAGERLLLTYQRHAEDAGDEAEEFSWGGTGTRGSGRAAYEEGRTLFAEAEVVLASGDLPAAVGLYRRAATLHSANVFVSTRLLQLLTASRSTLREAEELASALLARNPNFPPALLARAVAASERERPLEAAALYERLAQASEPLPALEAATALTAAAEMRLRGGQAERALVLLETVRAARPAHPRALDVLRQLYAGEKRWSDWLALLRRRELEEPDAQVRAKLLAEAGQVLLDELGQASRAAERFAEAVVLDEGQADAWMGLGRSRKRNGALDGARVALERAVALLSARGQAELEAQALSELADCEESAGVDAAADAHWARALEHQPSSVDWLRRRARVLARLGRGEEAAGLLARASEAARTSGGTESPAAQDLEVERAGLLGRVLGDRARARAALEGVLRSAPAHLGALDELAAQAPLDDLGDVLVFFERALERIVDPSLFAAVLVRAREVADRAGERSFVQRALATSAATGSPAGARAAVAWAEEVLQAVATAEPGAPEQPPQVPEALRAALESYRGQQARLGGLYAEVALAQGRLAEVEGQLPEAMRAYEAGLEAGAPLEVLIELGRRLSAVCGPEEWRASAEAIEQAAERASASAPTAQAQSQLAELLILAAALLERAGDADAALALHGRVVEKDPRRPEPWRAIEAHHEAHGDREALANTLTRHAAAASLAERRDTLTRLGRLLGAWPEREAEAEAAFSAALEEDAAHVPALLWLATKAWEAGRLDESATLSRRLIQIAAQAEPTAELSPPQLADAHLRLARWDRLMGSAAEAESHLAQALALEPRGGTLSLLVDVLESADEREALVGALQKRIDALDPGAPDFREVEAELAGALERAGRSEEALVVYRRRLGEDANDVETLRRLVELCRRESRFDELLQTLERLLAIASQTGAGQDGELDAKVLRLEIARALWRSGRDLAGAEQRLRALVEEDAGFVEAAETLGRLLLSQGAWQQADEVLAGAGLLDPSAPDADKDVPSAQANLTMPSDPDEPALVLERARARLEGEAGDAAAYAVLRAVPLEGLPPAGLALRAQLARVVGEPADVAAALAEANRRLADEADSAPLAAADREGYQKLAELEGPEHGHGLSLLERLARRGALDPTSAAQLARLYQGLADPSSWEAATPNVIELLESGAALLPEVRGNLWMKLAQVALEQEDLGAAEDRFARALAEPVSGATRASWLVSRAEFAVNQNALDAALADLDEALAADPQHAGALAALGDLSYRLHDWAEARRAYDALANKPDADKVVQPVVLAFRQAELSEMFGDETAAEANYQKVLALDPQHAGAREALAQHAYMREDHGEVVRLLGPLLEHASAELASRRAALAERMGECLLSLGQPAEARPHLQNAVRLEPTRATALQRLTQTHELLGEFASAADLWNRLSRVLPNARERAAALYREGELRRMHLQDDSGAVDAFLRAADMDPTFAPALVRLIPYYWHRGDILEVAGVAADLHASEAGRAAAAEANVGLLLSVASAAAGDDVLAAKVAPGSWPGDEEIARALEELTTKAPDSVSGAARQESVWAFLPQVLPSELARAVEARVHASPQPASGEAASGERPPVGTSPA